MAFTASKVFSSYLTDVVNRVTNGPKINTDTIEAAIFNNSITPDQTVTSANSAYAAGVWTGGSSPNIVDTGTSAPAGWPYLGRPLASITSGFSSTTFTYDAADTVSANDVTTLTNATGCLVYDHTSTAVTDQGICYNYFGGSSTVTLGRFTIIWNGSGIFSAAL